MFNWLKSKKSYELDKKMQIECLVRYWYKTIEKHEDRLPAEFLNDSVNPKVVINFMTDVVQFGWEVNSKKMIGKGFSNKSVIQPHVGALLCAVMHYLINFSNTERDIYIGEIWWAMCFEMLSDLNPYSTILELTIANNCKEKLLASKGLE